MHSLVFQCACQHYQDLDIRTSCRLRKSVQVLEDTGLGESLTGEAALSVVGSLKKLL